MKFGFLTLFVAEPAKVRDWYAQMLGFTEVPHTGGFLWQAPGGGSYLGFHAARKGETFTPQGFQLHFEVADVDATVQELKQRGVKFTRPPRNMPWGLRHAHCADPSGVVVEIVGPPKPAAASAARKGAKRSPPASN